MRKIGPAVAVAAVIALAAACGGHAQTSAHTQSPATTNPTAGGVLGGPVIQQVPADEAPPNGPPIPSNTPP